MVVLLVAFVAAFCDVGETMLLTENETVQLLQEMLGGIGQKSLAAEMGMDPKTISDALNDSPRLYRNQTREATKEFFDNRLDESRTNVTSYIVSAYIWSANKSAGCSNELLGAIAKDNPLTSSGEDVNWSSVHSADDLEKALRSLPTIKQAAAALKECIQIESWLEQKIRVNRGKGPQDSVSQTPKLSLHNYEKELRAMESIFPTQAIPSPVEHVRREWLLKSLIQANGSVIVLEAPAGYGKTTILETFASGSEPVGAFVKCKWDDPIRSDQVAILDLLSDQLASTSTEYRRAIERLSSASESPSGKVDAILAALQRAAEESPLPTYAIIDALDELNHCNYVLNLLDRLARTGGFGWLKVLCSTRQWEPGREDGGFHVIRPLNFINENVHDIESYALMRLSSAPNDYLQKSDDIAYRIAESSEGIFQFAVIALDALIAGIVQVDDIDNLPPGVLNLYDWYLTRFLQGSSDSESNLLLAALNMVAASPSPVPEEVITSALSLGSRRWRDVKESLNRFFVRTETSSGILYAIFHKSFADYLFSDRHGGKTAKEEGVAYLALGCYRARGLDRLSFWAEDYIQTYMAWLLTSANNNALLDVNGFDLQAARLEVLSDVSYAKACMESFEPADDVIVFQAPAREEMLAWSAMTIFKTVSKQAVLDDNASSTEQVELVSKWLSSCVHYVFVLASTSRFDESLEVSEECICELNEFISSRHIPDHFSIVMASEMALLHETLAYDVLTVGQPFQCGDKRVTDHYDSAITLYHEQNDVEGYLKAACNKALYEAEHVDAGKALADIELILSGCGFSGNLSNVPINGNLIEVSNPCRPGEKCYIGANSAFNHFNNLGYCLTLAGRELEALLVFEACEALAYDETGADRHGPFNEHDKFELFHLQAMALYRLGEHEHVIACEERAIPGLQEVWGASSAKLCGPYNMIGNAKLALGQARDAVICFEKALSIALVNWPPTHSRLINIRLNLARAAARCSLAETDDDIRRQFIDVASYQIKALHELQIDLSVNKTWEDPDSGFLKTQAAICELLRAEGEIEKAIQICEKTVNAYRAEPTPNARSLGSSLLFLAELQIESGEIGLAKASLKEAESVLKAVLKTSTGDYSTHPIWIRASNLKEALIIGEIGS